MHKDVISVPPNTTIEESVAVAQARKVGSLVISENNRVIGIATTNDIFMAILNPLLGIGNARFQNCGGRVSQRSGYRKMINVINQMKIESLICSFRTSLFPKSMSSLFTWVLKSYRGGQSY